MPTPATLEKRAALLGFIQQAMEPFPAVQGVIAVGSIASGQARPDSDIDAVVMMDPYDPTVVPAEFAWRPSDGSFRGIFDPGGLPEDLRFDLVRLDLRRWSSATFSWPEGRRAELARGWLAFDRRGEIRQLIEERTAYLERVRTRRLDEALTWLDQHLAEGAPEANWASLGPAVAHDRLQAAYAYLVQGLFAYNRRWRPWRNRQMSELLALTWLPRKIEGRILGACNAHGLDQAAFEERARVLRSLFADLLARLQADGTYGADPVSEAFIRSHNELGRSWNMVEWNQKHQQRLLEDSK